MPLGTALGNGEGKRDEKKPKVTETALFGLRWAMGGKHRHRANGTSYEPPRNEWLVVPSWYSRVPVAKKIGANAAQAKVNPIAPSPFSISFWTGFFAHWPTCTVSTCPQKLPWTSSPFSPRSYQVLNRSPSVSTAAGQDQPGKAPRTLLLPCYPSKIRLGSIVPCHFRAYVLEDGLIGFGVAHNDAAVPCLCFLGLSHAASSCALAA